MCRIFQFRSVPNPGLGSHHASDALRAFGSQSIPRTRRRSNCRADRAALRKIEHRGPDDLAHRALQVSGQVFRGDPHGIYFADFFRRGVMPAVHKRIVCLVALVVIALA